MQPKIVRHLFSLLLLLAGLQNLLAEPGSALYNPPTDAKNSLEFMQRILKQVVQLNAVDRARLDAVFATDKSATVDLINAIDRQNPDATLTAIRARLVDVWHQIDAETPQATAITKSFGPLIRRRVEADLTPAWRRNPLVRYLLTELVKSVNLQHERSLEFWHVKFAAFNEDLERFFAEIRRLSRDSCIDDEAYAVVLPFLWSQALEALSPTLAAYWESLVGATEDGSGRVRSIVVAVVEYARGSDVIY